MTLRRRLFISNILMTVLPLLLVWAVMAGIGFVWIRLLGMHYDSFTTERQAMWEYWQKRGGRIGITFIIMGTGSIIVVAINQFLTRNIINRVMKPLDTLCAGERQFSKNNLGFRIDYGADDEFRPVCDTFNEMASRLEKHENSRKELIAGISHDLRTPLIAIKMSVDGIKSGVAATDSQREKYLDIIENKTRDIEHIIEQLFLFSKLDIDEFKAETQVVNCASMIEDCIEEVSGEYEQRGLTLIADKLPTDIHITIDPLLFRRVIINIFENSVKYKTAETGWLFIDLGRRGTYPAACGGVVDCSETENSGGAKTVEIRLTDNGPGVPVGPKGPKESLEKLFEVFYRADPSRNNASRPDERTGSGLGLAISAKIVAKMGGTIHAELPAAGGLAIVITFPLAEQGANDDQ